MNAIRTLLASYLMPAPGAGFAARSHWKQTTRFALILFLLLSPGTFWTAHAESKRHVLIITSSDSSYQKQTAARIQQNLDAESISAAIIPADAVDTLPRDGATLHVAIGEHAIRALDAFNKNAIVLRINNKKIPDVSYTSIQSDLITAQSSCRQLQLIMAINPRWTTVGVLSSLNSADTIADLTRCAIRFNMNLKLYAIADERDLQKTLKTAVEKNKVILAVVDPLIYNSRTVKNILLTSYRHRKPVIGYSDSFVQAGAVAAIFTSPQTAAADAARIITDFFDNHWQFKKNTYTPSEFSVSTNSQVAASLEITLPEIDAILQSIRQMESHR